MSLLYPILRKILFQFEAEKSHHAALNLLKISSPLWFLRRRLASFPQRPVKLFGLTFPNPVGLAAGFDKNGDYLDCLLGLGFGFIEVGTVTPKPQMGNPKPRLFRIPAAQAIINRMGFNNLGVDYLVEKLRQRRLPGIIGANIGKNTQTPLEKAADDYAYCLRKVYPYVNYVTLNISSPNSPGLRHLQSSVYLTQLLATLDDTQRELVQAGHPRRPLLVKIDPDLDDAALADLVHTLLDHAVDGIIATNTTINHRLVAHLPNGQEPGGVSGEPLFQRSTQVLEKLSELLNGKLPLIAVGGILSAEDTAEKLSVGADLVQIYTGLIYQGPALIHNIVSNL